MATINYKLEEVTTPQIFDPPKLMLVWDIDRPAFTNDIPNLSKRKVIAILPKVFANNIVLTINHENRYHSYAHCAEIPDPPKPRRATNRELARWLAQGNGEYKEIITDHECCMTYFYYSDRGRDVELQKGIRVRKWEDTEWHEPDVFYMGLEDVK